jgi:hypothetical protein
MRCYSQPVFSLLLPRMHIILPRQHSTPVYVASLSVGARSMHEMRRTHERNDHCLLAPHMSLLPSVICECVGISRYTTAFGILFLFRGVTSIIGPPAAGLFYSMRF